MEFPKVNKERQDYLHKIAEVKFDIFKALSKYEDMEYLIIQSALGQVIATLNDEQVSDKFKEK